MRSNITIIGFLVSTLIYSQAEINKSLTIPEMIKVIGGTMSLGCTNEQLPFCNADEQPAHKVNISNFSISKYEITTKEFCEFLNASKDSLYFTYNEPVNPNDESKTSISWHTAKRIPGITPLYRQPIAQDYKQSIKMPLKNEQVIFKAYPGYDDFPVSNISFFAALKYTEWLSKTTGDYYRLPTEAEWEYAARGGTVSKCLQDSCFIYSGSNNPYEIVSMRNTSRVGSFKPNQLGIYDMSGNVSEFVLDVYDKDFYKQLPKESFDPIREYNGYRYMEYETRFNREKQKDTKKNKMRNIDFPAPEVELTDRNERELERVVKGGSYLFDEESWRVSSRTIFIGFKDHRNGFRIVRI